LGNACSA